MRMTRILVVNYLVEEIVLRKLNGCYHAVICRDYECSKVDVEGEPKDTAKGREAADDIDTLNVSRVPGISSNVDSRGC